VPGRVVPFTTTAQPDLAASTHHSYRQTLGRLERNLGANQQLATLTADQIVGAAVAAWAGRAWPCTRGPRPPWALPQGAPWRRCEPTSVINPWSGSASV
jgi:hypothetical protein